MHDRTSDRDRRGEVAPRPHLGHGVRHRPRWRRGAALLVAATAVATVGCGSNSSGGSNGAAPTTTAAPSTQGVTTRNITEEGEPVEGGKFVIGLEAETEAGLNPISGQFAASGHLMASSIFDPLATLDEDGKTVPYLAESIEPNADFTEWTIKVRDGVQFHDGTPLTSDAVKATLDGHGTSIVTKDAIKPIVGTEVVDPLTVKVTMSQPWAQFPYTLTTQVGYIPAPSMLADPEGAFRPVGTGPFVFESWSIGKSFQATKNESYWQAGKPHLSSIEFQPIPDSQARAEAVIDGKIDLMATVLSRTNEYLRDRDVKMLEVSNGEESSITLNTATAPFDNPIARQAVAAATDVDRFLEETGRDLVEPAAGVFAPGQLGYREGAVHQTFDLEKAKELTAQYEAQTGQPLSFVYDGAAAQGATKDGNVYGLAKSSGADVLFVNLDKVEEAGMDPAALPQTWDELVALAQAISEVNVSDKWGNTSYYTYGPGGDSYGQAMRILNWFNSNNAPLGSDLGVPSANLPGAAATWVFHNDLMWSSSENLILQSESEGGSGQLFNDGVIALKPGWNNDATSVGAGNVNATAIPFPLPPGGKPATIVIGNDIESPLLNGKNPDMGKLLVEETNTNPTTQAWLAANAGIWIPALKSLLEQYETYDDLGGYGTDTAKDIVRITMKTLLDGGAGPLPGWPKNGTRIWTAWNDMYGRIWKDKLDEAAIQAELDTLQTTIEGLVARSG